MGVIPNLNKASSEEEVSTYGAPIQATQLVGCYLCLMNGNVENPEVIFHYAGTTYCMDHLYTYLTTQQPGVQQ